MSDTKEAEEEIVWHEQQEKILKKWSEIGSSYRFMHDRSYLYFEKQNFRFALPVIILSTITGTANFAQGSFPSAWQSFVPLFIGFLNLSAGLITTVAQFLRVSELLEGHRAASISYSKFSRNISVELSLPPDERSCSGRDFIASRRVELDRLIEQSPNIPMFIVKEFGAKFADNEFMKPDILEIKAVDVFKDDLKKKMQLEKMQMEKKEFEMKLLKDKQEYEENLIKKVRDEETARRTLFETELRKRITKEKQNIINAEKIKAEKKKKKLGISSISKSMGNLIKQLERADKQDDILTPDTSDLSSSDSSGPIADLDDDEKLSDSPRYSTDLSLRMPVIEEENEILPNTNDLETVIDISNNEN